MRHCNTVHRIDLEYVKYKLPGYLHTFKPNDFNKDNSSNKGPDTHVGKRLQRDKPTNDNHKKIRQEEPSKTPNTLCIGCGKPHAGGVAECQLKTHPDYNHTTSEWKNSVPGKAWKAAGEESLPHYKTLAGGKFVSPLSAKREENDHRKGGGGGKSQYKKGIFFTCDPSATYFMF